MADLITSVSQEKVKPQVPGTVAIGKTAQAPQSPPPAAATQAAPPNVNGGAASFSNLTGAIQDLLDAKQTELSASIDALKANNAVDQQTSAALSGIQTETLGSFHNIEKIESLPGGVGGKLAKIVGLFNEDYNADLQQTHIQENQLRAQQITSTASAMKEQNNALPAILSKNREAAKSVFDAFAQANTLAIQAGDLQQKQIQTRIAAAHLSIDMSQERRQQVEFAVRSQTTEQTAAYLEQAKQGKGPFKDAGGLLEAHLMAEKSAEASMRSAIQGANKGDREEFNANALDFVSHLPADYTKQALQRAHASGALTVDFQVGVDKNKKPIMFPVPIPIVEAGLVKNIDIEQQVNERVAADITQRTNLIPKTTSIINGASALVLMDPRAGGIVTQTGNILKSLDPKNPNNVRQVAALMDQKQKEIEDIAKQVSLKFSTPEARAAVVSFGTTGSFEPTGGMAVVADSVGLPLLPRQTLYKGAFGTLNTLVVRQIQKQHPVSGSIDFSSGEALTAQQVLTAFTQRPEAKASMRTMTSEILADPKTQKIVADQIAGVVRPKAVNDTVQALAQQKSANPIWKEIYDHPESYMSNVNGKPTVDYAKLFQTFEQHRVMSGGKLNFSQTFLSAMRNYAVNADNSPEADSRYTVYDHALEAAVFGGRPHSAILGDFIGALAQQAHKAHEAMQARIQQDVSGQTQGQAITQGAASNLMPGGMPMGMSPFGNPEEIMKKTGVNIEQVPSATGAGLTAAQVKKLFGGGH